MKNYSHIVILVFALGMLPGSARAEQQDGPAALSGVSGTKNGLALQKSNVHNIQSILGPTLVFKVDLTSDVSRMCYVSTLDYSLVAFEIEYQLVTRLRVMSDKHRYDSWDWCTATPLAADDLTLANGITLGLKPDAVVKILGAPRSKDRDKWRYRFGPLKQELQKNSGTPKHPGSPIVWMEMEFKESSLVEFDLHVSQSN